MKDTDLKFCDEQITKKQAQLVDLKQNLDALLVESDDYMKLEKYYKSERTSMAPKIQAVRDNIHKCECELGQMKHHRSELKKQKKFLEYQHKMIDNQRKDKC